MGRENFPSQREGRSFPLAAMGETEREGIEGIFSSSFSLSLLRWSVAGGGGWVVLPALPPPPPFHSRSPLPAWIQGGSILVRPYGDYIDSTGVFLLKLTVDRLK